MKNPNPLYGACKERDARDKAQAMEKIKASEIHLDKIRGSLFGGAVGDALGYPVEFMSAKRIEKAYGVNGITKYELEPDTGTALISDDTQMTLFTVTGCLVTDTRNSLRGICGPVEAYIKGHYDDWLCTQYMTFKKRKAELDAMSESERGVHSWLVDEPRLYSRRAPGNTCLSALSAEYGKPSRYMPYENPINNSKGCGAVMRVAPIGLSFRAASRNMENVAVAGANVAALTHGHPLAYMSAAMLVHIINRLVFPHRELGAKNLKELVQEALDTAKKLFAGTEYLDELVSIIELAVQLAESKEEDRVCIRKIGEGWVSEEALAIAIFCALRHQDDFSAGVIAAVNHDGDSDSTGAVTGNILGALLGYNAIDEKWKTHLELSDVILELADDLCHGCPMDEFSSYEDADWTTKYIDGKKILKHKNE